MLQEKGNNCPSNGEMLFASNYTQNLRNEVHPRLLLSLSGNWSLPHCVGPVTAC